MEAENKDVSNISQQMEGLDLSQNEELRSQPSEYSFETPQKNVDGNCSELCAVCLSPLLARRRINFDNDTSSDSHEKEVSTTRCQVTLYSP